MGGFFSLDGPFYKFGSMLADVMILGTLWLLFCIPIVTIGPATSAVYFVTTRRISNKEGYILKDFFSSFKQNFKQSLFAWLIITVIGTILVFNIYYIWLGNLDTIGTYLLPVQLCLFVELSAISLYIFPIISRFDLKFKDAFKSAFYMANKHFITTILAIVFGLGSLLAVYIYPLYIFLAMGVYAYLMSHLFMRIYKKYRPEIDKDDLEDLGSVSN